MIDKPELINIGRLKAKGRALSAARLGLREAERQLRACGRGREADAAQTALKRSERLEQDSSDAA